MQQTTTSAMNMRTATPPTADVVQTITISSPNRRIIQQHINNYDDYSLH